MAQRYDPLTDSYSNFTEYESVQPAKIQMNLPLYDNPIELPSDLFDRVSSDGKIIAKDQVSNTGNINVNNNPEHKSTLSEESQDYSTTEVTSYKSNPNTSGNQKIAYDFFINKGLKPHHAAGIVGNLFVESAGLNPKAENPTSKAYGLAQWLGSRKKKLFAKYGNNPTFEQQLDFLWEELNGDEKFAFNKLLQTNSVKDATDSFMRHFERPSDKEMAQSISKRVKYAKTLLS